MGIENLLQLLNDNKVRFVIIGAAAFPVHGYSRATMDVDIFINANAANARRCLKASKKFGHDMTDISVEDLLTKKLLIRQYLTEIDIHPFVTGIKFNEVWKHRIKDKIGKAPVCFASLDDLIKMKIAANRHKDREDLRVLLALKKHRIKQI